MYIIYYSKKENTDDGIEFPFILLSTENAHENNVIDKFIYRYY